MGPRVPSPSPRPSPSPSPSPGPSPSADDAAVTASIVEFMFQAGSDQMRQSDKAVQKMLDKMKADDDGDD